MIVLRKNWINLQSIRGRCHIDESTDCWNWPAVQANGYGRIRAFGKSRYVHRIAYALRYGIVLESLDVCHACDNRRCCNPDHLFLGTRSDNMRDAKCKGRLSRGPSHPVPRGDQSRLAKLCEREVGEIRHANASASELARRYAVSVDNVRRILRRDTWRHVQ